MLLIYAIFFLLCKICLDLFLRIYILGFCFFFFTFISAMELSLNYEFHDYMLTSCFIQDQLHLLLQVSAASDSTDTLLLSRQLNENPASNPGYLSTWLSLSKYNQLQTCTLYPNILNMYLLLSIPHSLFHYRTSSLTWNNFIICLSIANEGRD